MPPMKMVHKEDPKQQIWNALGDLTGLEVMHNDVLIAIYIRPSEKKIEGTDKVIHLADQTIKEDEYQGKAGMVVKKGPLAFVSDDNFDFKGQDVQPGDWVSVWVSDGRKLKVNGVLCRMVEDRHIRMKIPAPDLVF